MTRNPTTRLRQLVDLAGAELEAAATRFPAPLEFYTLALFFVVHLGLHLLFLRHPRNEFKSALSWILIAGAGLAGALHFLAV